MKNILAIDVGGTSIKYALWNGNELLFENSKKTPTTLDDFYETIIEIKNEFEDKNLEGVAFSIPGAVNKKTGVIEGTSALPYIHNFNIQSELENKLNLKITMENDANCAALAELADGEAKGHSSLALFVIGTGIGGSLIFNNKVWHGAHLHGGEFGFMMTKYNKILSEMGSTINMVGRYNKKTGQNLNGKEVFDLAKKGEKTAVSEVDMMAESLATAIYNVQHSFDPELILIGGGVSNNPDLIPLIYKQIDKIGLEVGIPTIRPEIKSCTYKSKANLRGAVADFEQSYK